MIGFTVPHITLGHNFTGDISRVVFESDIILDNIYMENCVPPNKTS